MAASPSIFVKTPSGIQSDASSVVYMQESLAGGTRWRSQWRHTATSGKVMGSIPNRVTMAVCSTQPLNRNEYHGYVLGIKVASA